MVSACFAFFFESSTIVQTLLYISTSKQRTICVALKYRFRLFVQQSFLSFRNFYLFPPQPNRGYLNVMLGSYMSLSIFISGSQTNKISYFVF